MRLYISMESVPVELGWLDFIKQQFPPGKVHEIKTKAGTVKFETGFKPFKNYGVMGGEDVYKNSDTFFKFISGTGEYADIKNRGINQQTNSIGSLVQGRHELAKIDHKTQANIAKIADKRKTRVETKPKAQAKTTKPTTATVATKSKPLAKTVTPTKAKQGWSRLRKAGKIGLGVAGAGALGYGAYRALKSSEALEGLDAESIKSIAEELDNTIFG